MSNLYMIQAERIDGDADGPFNMDLFVIADVAEQALALWRDYCIKNGWAADFTELPAWRLWSVYRNVNGPTGVLHWHEHVEAIGEDDDV